VDPSPLREPPPVVAADMGRFLTQVGGETVDLKSLGIAQISLDEVLAQLGRAEATADFEPVVEPVIPMDILGLYIFLPAGA
jgi:hypothetical protein